MVSSFVISNAVRFLLVRVVQNVIAKNPLTEETVKK